MLRLKKIKNKLTKKELVEVDYIKHRLKVCDSQEKYANETLRRISRERDKLYDRTRELAEKLSQ